MTDLTAMSIERRPAGLEFMQSLQKLGLDPDALLWALETGDEPRMVLVLVTSFFDYVGPLEVSRLLFKAYNASATPKEINPFIVRLHSPRQALGRALLNLKPSITEAGTGREITVPPGSTFFMSDFNYAVEGILKYPTRKSSTIAQPGKWKRFSENVERLAA